MYSKNLWTLIYLKKKNLWPLTLKEQVQKTCQSVSNVYKGLPYITYNIIINNKSHHHNVHLFIKCFIGQPAVFILNLKEKNQVYM